MMIPYVYYRPTSRVIEYEFTVYKKTKSKQPRWVKVLYKGGV